MTLIIKHWSNHYEKSDQKKCKEMKWIAVPIKFEGLAYRRLMKMSDGVEIFGVWVMLLQLAGRMEERGIFKDNGRDLTLDDIGLMTDCPLKLLKKAISLLISENFQWIQETSGNFPENSRIIPTTLQDNTGHNNTGHNNIYEKNIFDIARKIFPGTKRDNEIEFENFKKKNKDFKEVIPLLKLAIENEITHKKNLNNSGQFCPEWKNFSTWINGKYWTQELHIIDKNKTKTAMQIKESSEYPEPKIIF